MIRRLKLALLFLTIAATYTHAQSTDNVALKDVNIIKLGNNLQVSFTAEIGKKATKQNYKLILTPTLYNEKTSKNLKQIVIETRSTRIMDERLRISQGKRAAASSHGNEYLTTNQSKVNYSITIPYEQWMNGSNLRIDRLSRGCCDEALLASMNVSNHLALIAPPVIEITKVTEKPRPEPKIRKWKFSKKDMIIDFSVSNTTINLALFENKKTLDEVVEVVKLIQATSKAAIDKVEITGYASPEGKVENNNRLANNRSVALKKYIQTEIPTLLDNSFDLRAGGENWAGLRILVAASNMPFRDEVLHIIDHVPAEIDYVQNTSRKKSLMDLKGGIPYNYMLKNFFPKLRNACYIGIYYLNEEDVQQ